MGRVMGSIPVGDSDVFFVSRSCHVDELAIYKTSIFTLCLIHQSLPVVLISPPGQ